MLGTAFVWGAAWLPIGIIAGVYRLLTWRSDVRIPGLEIVAAVAGSWTTWGAASGVVFATLLMLTERHRDVDTLSLRRTALWGALGAMVLPSGILGIVFWQDPTFTWLAPVAWTLSLSAVLGGTCAAGTLLLGQRAPSLTRGRS